MMVGSVIEEREVLHVIVGHGLPGLFLNAVRSFHAVLPRSDLLVIDNGSPQLDLQHELARLCDSNDRTTLHRQHVGTGKDPKVGTLYDAYAVAFQKARSGGYRYVHLLQGDMQMMWWDGDLRAMLGRVYDSRPDCVNIYTRALSSDDYMMQHAVSDGEVFVIGNYGMTDTGLYDLDRWARARVEFQGSEEDVAATAIKKGLVTVVSPWPTDIAVPWPAVVRKGRQVGREVETAKPFLCRPMRPDDVDRVKRSERPVTVEDICIPWGWSCLSPMSETWLSWYYLNYRRHGLRLHGFRRGAPRWARSGLDRPWQVLTAPHRPPLVRLIVEPMPALIGEIARRLTHGLVTRGASLVRRR
jgi:hypothetical protein